MKARFRQQLYYLGPVKSSFKVFGLFNESFVKLVVYLKPQEWNWSLSTERMSNSVWVAWRVQTIFM